MKGVQFHAENEWNLPSLVLSNSIKAALVQTCDILNATELLLTLIHKLARWIVFQLKELMMQFLIEIPKKEFII